MSDRDDIDRLEARLARARREGEPDGAPALDEEWTGGVMRSVRALSAPTPRWSLERLVLGGFVTSAAAAVAAALLVLVGGRDPASALERLLAADPAGLFDLVLVLGSAR